MVLAAVTVVGAAVATEAIVVVARSTRGATVSIAARDTTAGIAARVECKKSSGLSYLVVLNRLEFFKQQVGSSLDEGGK